VSRSVRSLEGFARWLVISSAVAAPWLFGASDPWASDLVSLLALTGAVVWLIAAVASPPHRLRAGGLTALLVILLALIALQAVPLPHAVVRLLSPLSSSAAGEGMDLLRRLGLSPDGWTPSVSTLSVAPGATRAAAGLVAVYILAFLVIANGTHHWSDLRRMAAVVLGCGFILVLISLIHGFTHSRELLWFHVPRYMVYGFGPFNNRNHFATHALLLFGLATGAFLASAAIPALRGAGWRERVLFLSTRGASGLAMLALAMVVTASAVLFSMSRGAAVSLVAAVGAAFLAWTLGGESRGGARRAVAAVVLMAFALVVWLGWQPVVERLSTLGAVARDPVADLRAMAAADTLSLFGMSPALGVGFGAFQYVFPVVARTELQGGRWVHTHNDWIEYLAEGGVAGGLLVALAAWLFVREVARKMPDIPTDRRRFVQGCLIGMCAVAIQNVVDFGLRKPANGMLLAVLAGMVIAALRRPSVQAGEDADGSSTAPESRGTPGGSTVRRAAFCAALVLAVALWSDTLAGLQDALAFKRFERLERIYKQADDPAMLEAIVAAVRPETESARRLGGRHPELVIEVVAAQFLWAMDRRLPAVTRRLVEGDALHTAAAAVRAAPTDPGAWLWLGRGYALTGRWAAADRCLERATGLRPRGAPLRLLPAGR
jgi:O-antigen ligase